ncbi:SDR family NAD(P)-dependent oxidoreductase [Mycolicibacterium sp. 018/SC-01/001]|uniref:SDR family NAD(P)-dependent oxidoreductase n=1 Tax=Mycolicibacterium sp. 018/SC-01/001 TaxID=2592069 RepID=UPI00117C9651|nr:SDR family NAD(P)-dependent oxidoreductase [Mycolicibacterium sp. 018/SC-01/001]TRW89040.1 SDR family NAD(P)-dependent oxidoreductase [Mycolicibacterium sp. 018/SC-01/001]
MDDGRDIATPNRTVLVIGASRGLGEAIVETYVARGARVVATVRDDKPSALTAFATLRSDAVTVEHLDITDSEQLDDLRDRLADNTFDLMFVVAGVSLAPQDAIGADIDTADFHLMMDTNVLGVMRTVERLQDVVDERGTIAIMSSGQGSIANNATGGFEVYRATKSALNQMVRSYAARHAESERTLLLMAPGWVKTAMGGPDAKLDISESIPALVDTVDAQRGVPGLRYLDRFGETVPW